MARYEFREGQRISGRTAEEVQAELTRIRALPGAVLSPQAVVDAARPPDALLHGAFEWDDSVAGEQYRLGQARRLIRVVIRVDDEADGTERRTPAQVRIEQGVYEQVEVVVARPDLFEVALMALQRKVREAERSVRELEDAGRLGGDPDRMARIGLAVAAFDAVKEALAILR